MKYFQKNYPLYSDYMKYFQKLSVIFGLHEVLPKMYPLYADYMK